MSTSYTGKRGELRIYDATATPLYAKVKFATMNLTSPEGAGRPDEVARMNRGNLDANFHYVQGPDNPITEPFNVTFSFFLESGSTAKELIQKFIGLRFASGQDATWQAPDSTALVTTKGTSQRAAGLTGTGDTMPLFTDPKKVCVNVEVVWDEGANDAGRRYQEVWFSPPDQSINEAPDGITCNLSGRCYGAVTSIAAFTAGTEKT